MAPYLANTSMSRMRSFAGGMVVNLMMLEEGSNLSIWYSDRMKTACSATN